LRDVLIASAVAAVAAGVPYSAYAHGHAASKQASATGKNVAAVSRSDREQRWTVRTKLFASHPTLRGSRAVGGEAGDGGNSGIASVYSDSRTASGEAMISGGMTAAHRSLPFGTQVTVVNKNNGRSIVVRINDRGPFVRGRVIDLSTAAARALGVNGLASVSLSVMRRAEKRADAELPDGLPAYVGAADESSSDHADHVAVDHVDATRASGNPQADAR
jgi:peptidoglycan lytic transglycosylase